MHSVSPVNKSLTRIEARLSTEISQALPSFPTSLSDLISQMATSSFELARQPLELDVRGDVVQNQHNQEITACIESALTSPSSVCDPAIKTAIFINATMHTPMSPILRPYLIAILEGLTARQQQINLDQIMLRSVTIKRNPCIDLTGISARGATFSDVTFGAIKMVRADFTHAHFFNTSMEYTDISEADITDATLTNVRFYSTEACGLCGNQMAVFRCARTNTEVETWGRGHFNVKRSFLFGSEVTGTPGAERMTLPKRYQF